MIYMIFINIQTLNIECFKCRTITPGRRYTVGSAGAIFYVAGGASDDYAKVIKNEICSVYTCNKRLQKKN